MDSWVTVNMMDLSTLEYDQVRTRPQPRCVMVCSRRVVCAALVVTAAPNGCSRSLKAAAEREAAGANRTRQQRRRDEPPPAHGGNVHAEEGHEEFDPAMLREHEEFTKVRNILSIELGRYEMDTWYFSPFPPEYKDVSKLFFCEVRACVRARLHAGDAVHLTHGVVSRHQVHARVLQAQGAAAAPPAQE